MATTRLGLEAVLYRNNGTYAAPALVRVDNVVDLTVNLEKAEANVTTRGNNGWEALLGSLKTGSIDFNIIWNTTDANFTALKNSFFSATPLPIEFFIMSADVDEADSEGLRATFDVFKFTKNEQLREAQSVDITIKPTISANAPQWVVAGPYSGFD